MKTIESAVDGTGLMDFKVEINKESGEISVKSILFKVTDNLEQPGAIKDVCVSWSYQDEHLGSMLLSLIQNIGK